MHHELLEVLRHHKTLRLAVQSVRASVAVSPSVGFFADLVRGRTSGEYTSKRTGQRVVLRPRLDLQVARELVSKDGYAPPRPVAERLAGRSLRVADLGANIGLFTLSAVDRYGPTTSVTAVEPDSGNLAVLRQNIAANGYEDRVRVVPAAAGTAPGSVRFAGGRRELSRIAQEGEDGEAVPMVDAFDVMAGCDLVKIDIEGGEWPILRDERLHQLAAAAVVMEWHARASGSNQPAREAEELLRAAGYEVQHHAEDGTFVGELWAWRP